VPRAAWYARGQGVQAMRIERLVQENLRTQGSVRREWYRRHSPAHLAACGDLLDAVLAARDTSAPAQALVLGAGACTELPLERLARACATVTLVDVDAPGMAAAPEELPVELRGRVELVTADVAGGVSVSLAAELCRQPWADFTQLGGLDSQASLDAAALCLERCAVADPRTISGLEPHSYGLAV